MAKVRSPLNKVGEDFGDGLTMAAEIYDKLEEGKKVTKEEKLAMVSAFMFSQELGDLMNIIINIRRSRRGF